MKFNERGQEILHNLKLAQQKDIAVQTWGVQVENYTFL